MSDLSGTTALFVLLGDATRVRLLSLLDESELTVAELVQITDLGQSRVSTHLGKLRDAGLVCDRRSGSSSFYRLDPSMSEDAQKAWQLVRDRVVDPVLDADRDRCAELLSARERWPDSVAGQMERHYSPGRTWESLSRAFLGLVDAGRVLDVGAGDGTIAQLLAPFCSEIVCIERSEKLVRSAVERCAQYEHVDVRRGDMHELPVEDRAFDHVLMLNVLQYSHVPERAIKEASRVLRTRGRMTIVTLDEHSHEEMTASYGHLNAGIASDALAAMLEKNRVQVISCDVTSRERRKPNFRVVTAYGEKT